MTQLFSVKGDVNTFQGGNHTHNYAPQQNILGDTVHQYFGDGRPEMLFQIKFEPRALAETIADLHSHHYSLPLIVRQIILELLEVDLVDLPMVEALQKVEQGCKASTEYMSDVTFSPETADLVNQVFKTGFKDNEHIAHILHKTSILTLVRSIGYPDLSSFETDKKPKNRTAFLVMQMKCRLALCMQLKKYLQTNNENILENVYWQLIEKNFNSVIDLFNKHSRSWEDDYAKTGVPHTFNLPQRSYHFVETQVPGRREPHLTKLYRELQKNKTVVITGMGGVGKSTLAASFVQEANDNGVFDVVAWIPAETEESTKQAYVELLDRLEKPVEGDLEKISFSTIKTKLNTALGGKQFLIVYDNLPMLAEFEARRLEGGHSIVTTRMNPGDHVSSIRLDVFSEAEALRYMQKIIQFPKGSAPTENENQLKLLAKKLDYLPLALAVSCGYINNKKNRTGINKYIENFDLLFAKTVDYLPDGVSKSLYTSLQLSVGLLSESMKELFFSMCYLSPDSVVVESLKKMHRDEDALMNNFIDLEEMNLTKLTFSDDEPQEASMHRLTQDVGRLIFEKTLGEDPVLKQQALHTIL